MLSLKVPGKQFASKSFESIDDGVLHSASSNSFIGGVMARAETHLPFESIITITC